MKLFLWAALGLNALYSTIHEKKRDGIYLGNNGENIVDLSYTLSNESYIHPVHGAKLSLTKIPFDGDISLAMNRIEMAEHSGTHMDALNHIIPGGLSVNEIPLSNLMGRGVLIDVTKNGVPLEGNVDITLNDFKKWEEKHGKLCCGRDILFFRTGLGQFFERDINRYLGTQDINDMTSFQFPGLHPELATFLVEERMVRVVGIDTISTDTANRTDLI